LVNQKRLILPGLLVAVGAAVMIGCIPIPTFNAVVAGRDVLRQLDQRDPKSPLKVGIASRSAILAKLGEPFHASEDGRFWVYSWKRQPYFVIWPFCFYADAETNAFAVAVEFDEGGVASDVVFEERPGRSTGWNIPSAERFIPTHVMLYDHLLKLQVDPEFNKLPPDERERTLKLLKAGTRPSTRPARNR
jgi:hypothetical protein